MAKVQLPWISAIALTAFLIPQLTRTFLFPDSSIDGRGRTLALNILDATPECQSHFILKSGVTKAILPLEIDISAPRIRCDPIVMHARIRELCRLQRLQRIDESSKHSASNDFDVDVILETRIVTGHYLQPVS
jgi:hypothetical protein